MSSKAVSIAVIAASFAMLAYVFIDRTDLFRPKRTEAGQEYIEAVRGLYLLELAEKECTFTLSRTITLPWSDRIPLDELDCELEVGIYYSVRVTAGIDLSSASDDFIRIEGQRADITLPAPEIVNTIVREAGSSWIRTGGIPRNWDEELMSARAEMSVLAESEAEEDATNSGIIQEAESVATAHVSRALASLGIEETHVSFE